MGALECEDRRRALCGKRERQREGEGRVQGSWSRPLRCRGEAPAPSRAHFTIYQRPALPQARNQHSIGVAPSTPHSDLLGWRCSFFNFLYR